MGAVKKVVAFEDLPTSEFHLDESGNWVERRAPIHEEPSGVRQRDSTPLDAHQTSVEAFEVPRDEVPRDNAVHSHAAPARKRNRLPDLLVLIVTSVVVAAAASWLTQSALPGERLQLRDEQPEPIVVQEPGAELGEPVYESAPQPRFEPPVQQIILEPIIIRASPTTTPAPNPTPR